MTDKEKDFLHGLAISAACAALPVRKLMPIAWSYNGVVLPGIFNHVFQSWWRTEGRS